MNILLLKPPSDNSTRMFNDITMVEIPLDLAYIAAVLEMQGNQVKIIDFNLVRSTTREARRVLIDSKYDLIGMTSTTPHIEKAFVLSRILKHLLPKARIVLGGWHASACPVETMNACPSLDFIIKGEGEFGMGELVDALEHGKDLFCIKGLVFRKETGEIVENEERELVEKLDDLPFPAHHLLNMNYYTSRVPQTPGSVFKRGEKGFYMITSRGCPHRCFFCSDHVIYKQRYRHRSVENIIQEIKELKDNYGISFIGFLDPNFMTMPRQVKSLCRAILHEKLNIRWACEGRVDNMTMGLLKLMKRSGCIMILFGLESGSQRILNLMRKKISIRQIIDTLDASWKVGIFRFVNFIFGFPGQTYRDVEITGSLINRIQPDFLAHSIAVPHPGSDLYVYAKEKGFLRETRWKNYNYFNKSLMNLENVELVHKLQKKIQMKYFFSLSYIWRTITRMRTMGRVLFYFKIIKNLGVFLITK